MGRNIPLFKTGDTPIANADGTVTYNNFGAGVMFIPSGLAYYSTGSVLNLCAFNFQI
jgi:hypothetical protein